MLSNNIYLGQESLESVSNWINAQLKIGTSVSTLSESLLESDRGVLIVTKWDGGHYDEYSNEEKLKIFIEYINENVKDHSKQSCISPEIQELMKLHYQDMDIDSYADYLTELLSKDGYQKIGSHITKIMACFKPYMTANYPHELAIMSVEELEIRLIAFIKEHLQECNEK